MCDASDYLQVCEAAVRAGGRVVQDWAGRFDMRKKGPADLVTQADFASQETVRQTVLAAFPDHSLLGEEGTVPIFVSAKMGLSLLELRPGHRGRLRREPNTAGSSIRWTGRRTTSTACPTIVSRWRWNAMAGSWSARYSIRSSTSALRPSKGAGRG